MKHRKTILGVAFFLVGLRGLHAQESVNSLGGEATGTGGTASYSVGQVVYTTNTGTEGTVAQGVQHSFVISSITLGINDASEDLKLSVYPNPTTGYLTLKTDDYANLNYHLYNTQGQLIESKKMDSNSSIIDLEGEPSATYFLNVSKNNQIVKTLKIIKN